MPRSWKIENPVARASPPSLFLQVLILKEFK